MPAKFEYLQNQAHLMVNLAIKHGDLIRPLHCSLCEKETHLIEGHHEDYSKPLDVVWVCRSCHQKIDPRPNQWGIKSDADTQIIFRVKLKATSIVRVHLADHPEDLSIPVRELAEKLQVGKSTVANVIREMKGGS